MIRVKVQLHNPTMDSKVAGYWMQNVLWAGGEREHNRYWRPGPRGTPCRLGLADEKRDRRVHGIGFRARAHRGVDGGDR